MAYSDELPIWVNKFGEKFIRYIYVPQLLIGVFLVLFSYHMGKDHFHLIQEGIRAQGTIIGYEQKSLSSQGDRSTAFMPIVQFQIEGKVVRFTDWLGSSVAGGMNTSVPIIYDSTNPSVAMIDRSIWNWIPWAPAFVLGLFLTLVAVKGWLIKRLYS